MVKRQTILYPGITQSVNTLRLVLANDDVLNGRSTQKVEDSVGICALSLLVAGAWRKLVTLHLSVEDLTRIDVASPELVEV
jgi:hypothetical protein